MDLFHCWLSQKPKNRRHASFTYSSTPETGIWICTVVVHDDGYVYAHTANTILFQNTQRSTKKTAKTLAVCALLHKLVEESNIECERYEGIDNESEKFKRQDRGPQLNEECRAVNGFEKLSKCCGTSECICEPVSLLSPYNFYESPTELNFL